MSGDTRIVTLATRHQQHGYPVLRRLPGKLREVVEGALVQGWMLEPADKRHVRLYRPSDGKVITVKSVPDPAAFALLRRVTRPA